MAWLGVAGRPDVRLSRITLIYAVVSAPPTLNLTNNTEAGPGHENKSWPHIILNWRVIAGVELQNGWSRYANALLAEL